MLITDPIGTPDLARFRLVDLFTACTHPLVKDSIITNPDRPLQVVTATVAFGMRLNCPNVQHIIHWGAPNDIESYIQETGRAGCDGSTASVIFYSIPHPSNKFQDDTIRVL